VVYTRHGNEDVFVAARKEVIVSAGTIDSPKLLMLSGLGPAEHLNSHNIPVIQDLPAVGNYLQDHISISPHPFVLNQQISIADPFSPETIKEYVENGTGPLLTNPIAGGQYITHLLRGYTSSSLYNDPTWPDIHMYLNQRYLTTGVEVPEEVVFAEIEIARGEQTGSVTLASSDPADAPLIDPRFFDDFPSDIDRLVEAIEWTNDLFLNSTAYQALGIKWSETQGIPIEQCAEFQFASVEYWRCYVRYRSTTAFHPTSTCRMGPDSTVAVVNSRLQVFGVSRLRVIDASVMPFLPSGNTNFPAIMVGEMGARIILNEI